MWAQDFLWLQVHYKELNLLQNIITCNIRGQLYIHKFMFKSLTCSTILLAISF